MKIQTLMLFLCFVANSVADDDAAIAKKAIEARFTLISKAFAAKDSKSLGSLFSDDFRSKSAGKPVVYKTEVLKEFVSQMKLMSNVKWTQKIRTFSLENGIAYVLFDSEMKSKIVDEDGMKHDFRLISKTKNEWIKAKSGWIVQYSESLESKLWMDGEEVKPGSDLALVLPKHTLINYVRTMIVSGAPNRIPPCIPWLEGCNVGRIAANSRKPVYPG